MTYYNTISFPFGTSIAFEDNPKQGSSEGALVFCESKCVRAQNVTIVAAILNGDKVQILIGNNTDHDIGVHANTLFARRAMKV